MKPFFIHHRRKKLTYSASKGHFDGEKVKYCGRDLRTQRKGIILSIQIENSFNPLGAQDKEASVKVPAMGGNIDPGSCLQMDVQAWVGNSGFQEGVAWL
ncbi:hypothetical protein [Candidatus Hecatella orcuttiae]|uniref:hypothetical protein n=1 Tax=Candidatus Hecatella orcuttiae TaxID=1935119 RepID=UPI0028681AA1|nr:hypothetical protein [Candidatus Hecatella orcuttiae]